VSTRSMGTALGIIGALLVLLGSVVTFILGVAFAVVDRSFLQGVGSTGLALEQFVVGVLLLAFTGLSRSRGSDYHVAGGVVLVVVSLVGLVLLGGGFLIVIGLILTLIAGILFVVPGR
jgi:hypothetical protein